MVVFKIHYGFLYEPIMCIIVFETPTHVPTNNDWTPPPIFLYKRSKYFCISDILHMFFHTLKKCTHKCTILLLMAKMEVSWKYDIQNGYAKIISPKIPDRISLMLIITILQLPSQGRIFWFCHRSRTAYITQSHITRAVWRGITRLVLKNKGDMT
jgi:hypothetical protein